eukprot:UN18396
MSELSATTNPNSSLSSKFNLQTSLFNLKFYFQIEFFRFYFQIAHFRFYFQIRPVVEFQVFNNYLKSSKINRRILAYF